MITNNNIINNVGRNRGDEYDDEGGDEDDDAFSKLYLQQAEPSSW